MARIPRPTATPGTKWALSRPCHPSLLGKQQLEPLGREKGAVGRRRQGIPRPCGPESSASQRADGRHRVSRCTG